MLRVLFLILCFFSVSAFAQTKEKPQAYKFFEYEKISDTVLTQKLEDYYKQLASSNSQGYIINYGKDKDAEKREKQIRKSNDFRGADPPKITYVRGDNKSKPKTILWIVPAGALPPTPN